MANRKFLVDIDLNKNQLLNAKLQNLASHPTVTPGTDTGFTYWNTTDEAAYVYTGVGTVWMNMGESNLSLDTRTTTTAPILNDNGDGVSIPVATPSLAGLESAADKTRLDKTVLTDDTNVKTNSWVIDEDNMVSNLDTKVPTQQSVKAFVDSSVGEVIASADAMVFKGTVGVGGTHTIAAFNALVVYNAGWTYRVITAGTIKGVVAQVGDLYLATVDRASLGVDADWTIAQTNIEAASDTVAGYVELATSAETITGSDSVRAVTPAGLQAKVATATVKGIVELATSAEVITGTDTDRAVTPDGLESKVTSETEIGLIELATQAEVNTGTDVIRAVTPATLESKLGLTGSLTTPRKYTENLATSLTSYTITHGLATSNVTVSVRDTLTPFHEIEVQVTIPNTSTIVLGFNVAPTAAQYQVTIIG
jgi:hypothetical protein